MSGNAHDEARALADAEIEQQKQDERFHEGQENSHKALDSSKFMLFAFAISSIGRFRRWRHTPISTFFYILLLLPSPKTQLSIANSPAEDERSIANKLAREEARNEDDDAHLSKEDKLSKIDATAPARAHGNEPSRGAKIDQQIREEEEEELRRKGKA